jgi:hypothetical protein
MVKMTQEKINLLGNVLCGYNIKLAPNGDIILSENNETFKLKVYNRPLSLYNRPVKSLQWSIRFEKVIFETTNESNKNGYWTAC